MNPVRFPTLVTLREYGTRDFPYRRLLAEGQGLLSASRAMKGGPTLPWLALDE